MVKETVGRQISGGNAELLSKWLVLELAATIIGSKPSTILSIADTSNRPLLTLWRQFGPRLLAGSPVCYFVLKETPSRLAILFYRRAILEQCINAPEHKEFLFRHNYPVEGGLNACLRHLKRKFTETCPHEFGLLLGIPLKDVLGFMGLSDQPLCCRGCWHIYGNPECSLEVMKKFNDDRAVVAGWLDSGYEPYLVLACRQDGMATLVS
ncbi:DUF3793 family protein|uniref:DUF3793 family protein n=1 Tax=Dendrosporobacter quercicolus TaxID=146817 RepID=A0A1G9QGN2_9FIRM|nr:DUF3793 family protein [Dendrosporobacter quercicolus]NSL48239.1 DUF3793 family protein [Dendrosporobacter quercicolus DSM 1736]SDM10212.1 Protein of unknown function [Dendrosporobacter quercicolus]